VPIRYLVIAAAVSMAGITYLDRVCVSILAPAIMKDLRLSPLQMGYVFSAFTLAYACFEIPTAWWADRTGSRRVLTRIVTWWSGFTMLTAAALNYPALLAIRFLFGAGEAGAWPCAARVFSRWIPLEERGRAQGIFFAGAHLAGGLTPALVVWIAAFLPWRLVFVVFGFFGLAWAAFWHRWFRDEPREHQSVSSSELHLIEAMRGLPAQAHSGSWRKIWATRGLVPLCLQYFANSYALYFFITWLPTYLAKSRGLASGQLAFFSGLPLMLSAAADVTGGWTTDSLSRRFGLRLGRCGVGAGAYLVAAGIMLAGTLATNSLLAGTLIAIAGALSMFTLAPSWATAIGLGGANAALLSATMNTAGQVGGVLSPIVLAWVVDRYGNWNLPLHIVSALYLVAFVCWLRIQPEPAAATSRDSVGDLAIQKPVT